MLPAFPSHPTDGTHETSGTTIIGCHNVSCSMLFGTTIEGREVTICGKGSEKSYHGNQYTVMGKQPANSVRPFWSIIVYVFGEMST